MASVPSRAARNAVEHSSAATAPAGKETHEAGWRLMSTCRQAQPRPTAAEIRSARSHTPSVVAAGQSLADRPRTGATREIRSTRSPRPKAKPSLRRTTSGTIIFQRNIGPINATHHRRRRSHRRWCCCRRGNRLSRLLPAPAFRRAGSNIFARHCGMVGCRPRGWYPDRD